MGRCRSFANRSVGPFTFILCFRHFHVQRATVLFCPRRRSQAGKGSTSLMRPPFRCGRGANARAANLSPSRSGRPCVASKSRSLHHPSSSISRWYFEGSALRRGTTGGAAAWLSVDLRRLPNGAPNTAERREVREEDPAVDLGHAAARDLRQWRVPDCADHRLASIEQSGLGSGRRRDGDFSRTVHRIAALG